MNSYPFTRCLGHFSSLARLGSVQLARQPLRYASDKCGKKVSHSCGKPPEKNVYEHPEPKPKLVSMWSVKDCESKLCEMDLRYDMKYYSISDKRKRKYQVTWNECPRLLIKPKRVCVYEKMVRPKVERRKNSVQVGAATKSCAKVSKKGACVYITAPCCKTGRRPPKCISPKVRKCEKKKTPYPSFSECQKDPLTTAPPVECRCLDLPALCDAWAVLRRRMANKKPATKSCGEA